MNFIKISQLIVFFAIAFGHAQNIKNTLVFPTVEDTKSFFSNSGSRMPIISAHRGGALKGYPENSLETFDYTLQHIPAIFEVDVRLTKDDKVVLMHDATLERTTSGKGKVKDHTLKQIKKLRLRDPEDKLTENNPPSLKEAIIWSRGKTLLNLDVKDVPIEHKVNLVKELEAFSHVIFTVHNAKQAKAFYDLDRRSMFSAFIKNKEALLSFERAKIPWENILIAYVGPDIKQEHKDLYRMIQEKGVLIMVSGSPIYDKLPMIYDRIRGYKDIFESGVDIIESDRPLEAALALLPYFPTNSERFYYWKRENK